MTFPIPIPSATPIRGGMTHAVVAGACLVLGVPISGHAADVETIRAGWTAFDEIAFGSQIVRLRAFGPDGDLALDQRSELVQSDEGWLRKLSDAVKPGGGVPGTSIRGANPQYSMILSEDDTNGDSSEWVLSDLKIQKGEIASHLTQFGHDDHLINIDCGRNLAELAKLDHFEWLITEQSKGQVKVSLSVEQDEERKRSAQRIVGGTLILDPENYYVVKEAEISTIEFDTPTTKKIRNQYSVTDGVPHIASQEIIAELPDGKEVRTIREFSDVALKWEGDRSIFYASHYGIPEPPPVRVPGSYRFPMWLFTFIGGVILAAGGAAAVYRATRLRPTGR